MVSNASEYSLSAIDDKHIEDARFALVLSNYTKPAAVANFSFARNDIFIFLSFSNMLLTSSGERAAVPIPPPSETEWYNGRLDRYSAEQRLKAAYKLGSYLGEKARPINIYASLVLIWCSFSPPPTLRRLTRPSGSLSEGKRPQARKLCLELFGKDGNQPLPVRSSHQLINFSPVSI
jgi:hypothetical protein